MAMSTGTCVQIEVQKLLDENANVDEMSGKCSIALEKQSDPIATYEHFKNIMGKGSEVFDEKYKDQMVTMLKQVEFTKNEQLHKCTIGKQDKLYVLSLGLQLSCAKEKSNEINVDITYSFLVADFSKEWFWRKWKMFSSFKPTGWFTKTKQPITGMGDFIATAADFETYDANLEVLFDLDQDANSISKDFIVMLQNAHSSKRSMQLNENLEEQLTEQIKNCKKNPLDEEFYSQISINGQWMEYHIQLTYKTEDESHLDGKGIKEYVRITGKLRSISIDPKKEWQKQKSTQYPQENWLSTKDHNHQGEKAKKHNEINDDSTHLNGLASLTSMR